MSLFLQKDDDSGESEDDDESVEEHGSATNIVNEMRLYTTIKDNEVVRKIALMFNLPPKQVVLANRKRFPTIEAGSKLKQGHYCYGLLPKNVLQQY